MNNSPERKLRGTKRGKNGYTPLVIVLIVAIIAVVAGTVTAVITNFVSQNSQEVISELSDEEIESRVREIARETNAGTTMIPRVQELFDQQLSIAPNDERKDNLLFLEISLFMEYSRIEAAASAFERLSFGKLSTDQLKMRYCIVGNNIYSNLGDMEKAYYYYNLAEENGYIDDVPGEG